MRITNQKQIKQKLLDLESALQYFKIIYNLRSPNQ